MKNVIISFILVLNSYYSFSQDNAISNGEKSVGVSPIQRQDSMVNGFELTAGTDDSNLSFKYVPINAANGLAITVTAPLDSSKKSGTLIDSATDAFANSTSVTINFRRALGIGIASAEAMKGVFLACDDRPEQFGFENSVQCSSVEVDILAKNYKGKDDEVLVNYIDEINSQSVDVFYFLGSTATYGRKEFTYFKDDTLDKKEETEYPWGFSLYLSRIAPKNYTFTASLEYQKGYRPAGEMTRCPVVENDSQTVECKTFQGKAPSENTNKNIKLSFRKRLLSGSNPYAIAPAFTYDLHDDEYNFSLPIYIFGNDKGELTGGVRYDYDSGKIGSKYSIFVGSTF